MSWVIALFFMVIDILGTMMMMYSCMVSALMFLLQSFPCIRKQEYTYILLGFYFTSFLFFLFLFFLSLFGSASPIVDLMREEQHTHCTRATWRDTALIRNVSII
jgi:hypothetical protein